MPGLFINEKVVFSVIVLNAIVLFFDSFPTIHAITKDYLTWIDYCCAVYFVLEISIKIKTYNFSNFWKDNWNRFDFIIVAISSPVLLSPFIDLKSFSVILILRLSRLFRLLKVLRFIPHREMLLEGILRSLKASVGVFLALFFLNFLFAIGATLLFGKTAPEYFGNPLISIYSMFKIFTVEGWYEIPALLISSESSIFWIFLVRSYFVVSVIVGGLLGLSLANAVFVDEMTADNNQKIEEMLADLKEDINSIKNSMNKDDENRVGISGQDNLLT